MPRKKPLICGIALDNLIFPKGQIEVAGTIEDVVAAPENIYQCRPLDGTVGFLTELHHRGFKVVVVTRLIEPDLAEVWCRRWELPIDLVVAKTEVRRFHVHLKEGTIRSQADHLRILNSCSHGSA
jgi:hypothetical protein